MPETDVLTPIQKIEGVYVKRDDLFKVAGVCGGKVRACQRLATYGIAACDGLITASARKSPQAQIVARVARDLGVPARLHMPNGVKTREMEDVEANGGIIIQHKAGYNNVIISRAKADHKTRPTWRYIPFGMEHYEAVQCTRYQVCDIPKNVKRVVVCVGSGMTAAGILYGLRDLDLEQIPVIGVRVGADPRKRLDSFAPFGWRNQMELVNVTDTIPYHRAATASIGDVVLDPHYEAKCLPYLRPGDLFWIVGIRTTVGD